MASRKSNSPQPVDSLGISDKQCWLVAVDHWGNKLESRVIPAGTDLYVELVGEHLRYHQEGWDTSGERMFFNQEFYVRPKGIDRARQRRVYFTGRDPSLPPVIHTEVHSPGLGRSPPTREDP